MPVKDDVLPRRWCYLCNALQPDRDFPWSGICSGNRFPFCFRHISHAVVLRREQEAWRALSLAGIPHDLPIGAKQ